MVLIRIRMVIKMMLARSGWEVSVRAKVSIRLKPPRRIKAMVSGRVIVSWIRLNSVLALR